MSDEITLNVGTERSNIDGSHITIGDISTAKPKRVRSNSQPNRIEKISEQLVDTQEEIDEIAERLLQVEELLGGRWGVGGMVAKVEQIANTILSLRSELVEIRQEIRESHKSERWWTTLYLIFASIVFTLALYMTINGLWN